MNSTTPPNHQAEEAIDAINKKTGRNMPQAIGTAVVLIVLILACLLISPALFALLVVTSSKNRFVVNNANGCAAWRAAVRRRHACGAPVHHGEVTPP